MAQQASVAAGHQHAQGDGLVARAPEVSCVARLAQFFPAATPVHLPVRVMATAGSAETVLEYGTARDVLFACALPLEFGERLRLRNADGSFDTEAEVVALQYHGTETAVAARFTGEVANWIVKS